ncbi:MAG: succinate dehydrogenase, hydrophobic membrane anchor protein [Steroidobacteraceae bacterium]|jgi:succinate dehydrogenase / fumarate reductase membrane anchor subunit|nr:succinate dehydrogenase, hydrophobic membrane anchor protein [Steroidobacteraceae bacterium]
MSLRSPLGRVLGHGSARQGVHHWWSLRTTSAALVLLGAWFIFALLTRPDLGHATVSAWIAKPVTAVLLGLFVAVATWHSALGVQVVIEDYVHAKGPRVAALVASRFLHALVGVAAVFAILRIALGGAA